MYRNQGQDMHSGELDMIIHCHDISLQNTHILLSGPMERHRATPRTKLHYALLEWTQRCVLYDVDHDARDPTYYGTVSTKGFA